MTHRQGTVMHRCFGKPGVHIGVGTDAEIDVGLGVADHQNRLPDRLPFADNQLQASLNGLGNAQSRDLSRSNMRLHRHAAAFLP